MFNQTHVQFQKSMNIAIFSKIKKNPHQQCNCVCAKKIFKSTICDEVSSYAYDAKTIFQRILLVKIIAFSSKKPLANGLNEIPRIYSVAFLYDSSCRSIQFKANSKKSFHSNTVILIFTLRTALHTFVQFGLVVVAVARANDDDFSVFLFANPFVNKCMHRRVRNRQGQSNKKNSAER